MRLLLAGWALLLTQATVLAGSDDAGQKSAPDPLSLVLRCSPPHPLLCCLPLSVCAGGRRLRDAAERGKLEEVKKLLAAGAPLEAAVTEHDFEGFTRAPLLLPAACCSVPARADRRTSPLG